MVPAPGAGFGALRKTFSREGRHREMGTSLRECIAGLHIARTEALLEPVHTLLRTAVRERLGIHGSARHPLQAVIAHCCCCIQSLAYFPGVEQVSLIGRVSPDAGKAV